MKRAAALMVLAMGCGGDDSSAQPDALIINPGPDYDLSCLGNTVSTVPTTIEMSGKVFTVLPTGGYSGIMSTVTTYTFDGNTEVGTTTTDDMAMYSMEVTTPGTPQRLRTEIMPTVSGPMPSDMTINVPPHKSPFMNANLYIGGGARIDALATALGTSFDTNKGALEVWMVDCTSPELVGASLQLDGADATWAMYSGVGVWIPRATTLGHPQGQPFGSVAGLVNVEPGMHTVKVTAPGLQLESTVKITAGKWSLLIMTPGVPLN